MPTTPASALDTLLQAAILAPSGDNTQPWRFSVDRERWTIAVDVDPSRDPSPMNAGQTMAQIALGAALENMVQTARYNRWEFKLGESPDGQSVRFSLQPGAVGGVVDPRIRQRVTNRRVYEPREIPATTLEKLKTVGSPADGIESHFLIDRPLRLRLAELIARADALILGTQPIRNAFLAKVRFDLPPSAEADEGLSLGSLEVSTADRLFLRLMPSLPDGLLRFFGARRVFANVARRLASSASGFCLITSTASDPNWIDVGRGWQRCWLELASEGLATQPMMSLLVLQNILTHGDPQVQKRLGVEAAQSVLEDFRSLVASHASGKPVALMRFGYAAPPTVRVGRRSLPAVAA